MPQFALSPRIDIAILILALMVAALVAAVIRARRRARRPPPQIRVNLVDDSPEGRR
jgi:hypothetical protein